MKVELQEKREQGFDGQRRAENIAHKARILGPVHAKLKFHDDAGHNSHGEVDQKQLAPKLRHPLVRLIPLHNIEGLHDSHKQG